MAKVIEVLTDKELADIRKRTANILISNHGAEFERIRKALEFNAKEAKANKEGRD